MATRRYKLSVGPTEFAIVEEVGAATISDTVELTIDLVATAVNDSGGVQRGIKKEEAIQILEMFINHLTKNTSGSLL